MFDLHVHTAPDVQSRAVDDDTAAGWYEAAGYAGFVLKGHYADTTGRAVAASQGHRVTAYGGIVLNSHVGGLNPVAVWAALQMGARVVWMPTIDAVAHRRAGLSTPHGSRPDWYAATCAAPPLDWSTEPALRVIFELIAEADAVLATGHLSGPEIEWLLRAAKEAGVRRLLLTHPTYSVPDLPHHQVAKFAATGAAVEITAFQLLHQSGCDADKLADLVRTVGASHIVLSSDAGQPDSPRPPEALTTLIEALEQQGIDQTALDPMVNERPEQLVVP